MRNWESNRDVPFGQLTLFHAGGACKSPNVGEHKISLFYCNRTEKDKHSDHYSVTWDFSRFHEDEVAAKYDWKAPHHIVPVETGTDNRAIEYYTSSSIIPLNKDVVFNDLNLKILNRPTVFAPTSSTMSFMAGAVDRHNNAYRVYWNLFNVIDPVEIVMIVDNHRQCKNCLTRWRLQIEDTPSPCKHQWVDIVD